MYRIEITSYDGNSETKIAMVSTASSKLEDAVADALEIAEAAAEKNPNLRAEFQVWWGLLSKPFSIIEFLEKQKERLNE